MRFLFCKSFICFCKSSSQIYSPAPLKLENSHHVPSTAAVVSPSATDCSNQFFEVKDEDDEQKQQAQTDSDDFVKSCLKKKTQLKETEKKKKKVRWMDYCSRERKALVEIREFERSEYEVRHSQNGSHACIIL